MAPSDKAGRVIFIGNIPYDFEEPSVRELFSTCGTVLNFRIVIDKDTGRPKGFGFLEYQSADEAASAVRNLNNHDVMGRNLRVDYSNESGGGDAGGGGSNKHEQQSHQQAQHWQQMQQAQQQNKPQPQHLQPPPQQQLPPPPPQQMAPIGVTLPDNVSAPDAISRTLSALDPNELLTVISRLKDIANTDSQQVNNLFAQQPQLAYAVFQALLLMGLVETNVLTQLIDTSRQQAPPPQQMPQPTPLPFQPPPQQHYAQPPPVQAAHFPPPQHFQQPPMMGTPVGGQGYPPPPAPQQPQKPPHMTDENWESIRQLCNLPQQTIDMMQDMNQRNTIMGLRQQYAHFFPQMQQPYRPMGY